MQINDKLTETQRDHFVSMIMEEERNDETEKKTISKPNRPRKNNDLNKWVEFLSISQVPVHPKLAEELDGAIKKEDVWNNCCNEWEAFLPDEKEIRTIINKYSTDSVFNIGNIAHAINERLGGKG